MLTKLVALTLIPILAAGPLITVLAQSATAASSSDLAPWLTAGAVITIAGLFYKFLVDENRRKQVRIDTLELELKERNKDDRQTLIPALTRNTEVLARIVSDQTHSGTSEG